MFYFPKNLNHCASRQGGHFGPLFGFVGATFRHVVNCGQYLYAGEDYIRQRMELPCCGECKKT